MNRNNSSIKNKCLKLPEEYVDMDIRENDSRGGIHEYLSNLGEPYLVSCTSTGVRVEHYGVFEEERGLFVSNKTYGIVKKYMTEDGPIIDTSLVQKERSLTNKGKTVIASAVVAACSLACAFAFAAADN